MSYGWGLQKIIVLQMLQELPIFVLKAQAKKFLHT